MTIAPSARRCRTAARAAVASAAARGCSPLAACKPVTMRAGALTAIVMSRTVGRSEEHTSELQSRVDLVCRLLLEKKNVWRRIDGRGARVAGSGRLLVAWRFC